MNIWVAVAFIVGLGIGLIFSLRSSGTLRIDHTNPEKDVYLFEIDNLDKLTAKRKVVLKIDNNAHLSQK